MYTLDSTLRKIQVKLGGAVTTNQLPITGSFVDLVTATQAISTVSTIATVTNSGTAVDIVTAPASTDTRTLKTLAIPNIDTAGATVTVILNDNGTLRDIVVVGLNVGDNLNYDDEHGWYVLDSAGNFKTSLTGAGTGTVTHSAGGLTLNQLVYGNGTADIKVVAATDGQIPIGKSSDGTAALATLTAGSGIAVTNAANAVTVALSTNGKIVQINATVNGGGSVPSTGVFADVWVAYACTLTANQVQADQSGSMVFDVWASTSTTTPPTIANTMVASAPPTISSAAGSHDNSLTGWTTSIAAGTWLRFNLNSVTTCTRGQLTLIGNRT